MRGRVLAIGLGSALIIAVRPAWLRPEFGGDTEAAIHLHLEGRVSSAGRAGSP